MRLLPRTNSFGIRSEWKQDGDRWVQKRTQDVEPFLERNAKMRAERHLRDKRAQNGVPMAASIPNNVYMGWMQEWGIDPSDWFSEETTARVIKRLNSPDYMKLRTIGGKL